MNQKNDVNKFMVTPTFDMSHLLKYYLAISLDQHFTDPNKPTNNEMVLFELENGKVYDYVITIYNVINCNFKG